MVISTRPLIDVCPVVPAAMEGRQIVQWDKDSCADAGFLKIDLLGLGMLSAVERMRRGDRPQRAASSSTSRASRSTTSRPTNRSAPPRPPASSRSRAAPRCRCCRAPSRATSTTSPCRWRWCGRGRSRAAPSTPTSSAASACARTRATRSPTSTRCCAPVLAETLGTIVYQEQVIEVAMALAGFSSSEAEGLRRAMSRKRSLQAIEEHHERLRRRRRSERGRRAGDRRAGLAADPGLLRLRLPEGALGGLRPARLPVGLAAGPPRPRVPLLAAERAADGLLPARLAGPRGAAARDPDRPAGRQPQRRPLPRRVAAPGPGAARRPPGADRPRLREGGAQGGDGGAGRRARARRALPGRSPNWPRARGRGWRASKSWPGRGRSTASRPTATANAAGRSGGSG